MVLWVVLLCIIPASDFAPLVPAPSVGPVNRGEASQPAMRLSGPADSMANRDASRRPKIRKRLSNAIAWSTGSNASGRLAAAGHGRRGRFPRRALRQHARLCTTGDPSHHTRGGGRRGAGGDAGRAACKRERLQAGGGGGRKQPERSEDDCGGLRSGHTCKHRLCRLRLCITRTRSAHHFARASWLRVLSQLYHPHDARAASHAYY